MADREKHYEPWIGVDLDGTLAHAPEDKKFVPDKIGKPVKAMIDRVRQWVDDGKTVKIFTARADDEVAVNAIKKWLDKHGIGGLDITNLKDAGMTELWDDRAVEVERNTGKVAESIVDILLEGNTWTEFWLSPAPELIQSVPGHIPWAVKHVLKPGDYTVDENGTYRGVYLAMRQRGFVRVVIEDGRIFVDPTHCSRTQREELEYAAVDRGCIVTDDKSGRDLFNPRSDS